MVQTQDKELKLHLRTSAFAASTAIITCTIITNTTVIVLCCYNYCYVSNLIKDTLPDLSAPLWQRVAFFNNDISSYHYQTTYKLMS